MSDVPAQSGIDGEVDVTFQGEVAIVTIRRGENRINTSFYEELDKALDKVEGNANAKVLITTGEGKFYSNGLDLPWLKPILEKTNNAPPFAKKWGATIRRLLTFPMPTIAALNGHAFAGGAVLAMCHDYRVMRSDRGWFCLNEVHIGLVFSPFTSEMLKMKIGLSQNFTEALTLGRRYTAHEALEANIIQAVADGVDVIPDAVKMARRVIPTGGYDRASLQNMKESLYQPLYEIAAQKGTPKFLQSAL